MGVPHGDPPGPVLPLPTPMSPPGWGRGRFFGVFLYGARLEGNITLHPPRFVSLLSPRSPPGAQNLNLRTPNGAVPTPNPKKPPEGTPNEQAWRRGAIPVLHEAVY